MKTYLIPIILISITSSISSIAQVVETKTITSLKGKWTLNLSDSQKFNQARSKKEDDYKKFIPPSDKFTWDFSQNNMLIIGKDKLKYKVVASTANTIVISVLDKYLWTLVFYEKNGKRNKFWVYNGSEQMNDQHSRSFFELEQ